MKSKEDLLYDWNGGAGLSTAEGRVPVAVLDETLRDGLQCPSVVDPPLERKMELLRLMAEVGVDYVTIGYPGASARAFDDVVELAKMVSAERLGIGLTCAARTTAADIKPIIGAAEKSGTPIEVMAFLGASPIRLYTENWEVPWLEQRAREAVSITRDAGLLCTFVTEDTTRSHPDTLRRLWEAVIAEGVKGLCLCDTCGHATPRGVERLVAYARRVAAEHSEGVCLDWHGHNDRGYSLINALTAAEAGVDRVHGCVLGIGERVGNTPLDLLLINLRLEGQGRRPLEALSRLVELASEACRIPIPVSYPVFGRDAFRTATGVHAAAILKAERADDQWLADRVYSSVPASWVGKQQSIEIGPMSGDANIRHWLRRHRAPATDEVVAAVRRAAKSSSEVLTDRAILTIVEDLAKESAANGSRA
ncbi:MAG: 2-isopropylmalate synthase [Deltaproteobacteria bacterium]|nr:2-isopropylmalate synthase [Deltaproteobacteria bacterium]